MPLRSSRESAVDFIEQWFGIAPDGGDGSLEVMWVAAIAVAALAFLFRRRIFAGLSRLTSAR